MKGLALDQFPLDFVAASRDGDQLVKRSAPIALPRPSWSEVWHQRVVVARDQRQRTGGMHFRLHNLVESHAPIMPEVRS